MKDAFGWIERVIPTRTLEDNILAIKYALSIIAQNLRKLDSERVTFLESILTPSDSSLPVPAVFYQRVWNAVTSLFMPQRSNLSLTGLIADDAANDWTAFTPYYSTVSDHGVQEPQKLELDFTGAGVTVTTGLAKTIIDIPGGGGSGGDSFLEWAL